MSIIGSATDDNTVIQDQEDTSIIDTMEVTPPELTGCVNNSIDVNGAVETPKGPRVVLTEVQHRMLERISKNVQVVVKSQQRDEPDMTAEQKLDELKDIFELHPEQFLTRFGKFLLPEDVACFDKQKREGNYGVIFHLKELETFWRNGADEKRLKNRRYEALKKLVETTDYFSEEEMQRRNPILYDQLIGRYHTQEEREAFLQQSWKSTSGSGRTTMPLTDLFLAHLERTDGGEGISCRRMAQETQQDEEDEADAEYDTEEDCDMESDEPGPSRREKRSTQKPTVNDDDAPREEIDDDEKELLKEEFFTTMYRNFLNGKDEDFDYATVDDNPEYDCGENLENDEEEKYFDDESPCDVPEPDSEQDDLFKPPVRSSEIESKIGNLSVNQAATESEKQECKSEISESVVVMDDDDEDELDLYMREIENQLKNK